MKRIAWLFVTVLLSAHFLPAQEMNHNKNMTMTGDVCDSKCTYQISQFPREVYGCRKDCPEKGGEAVLVTDKGKVMKIDNQDMVMPYMGKHVKVKATMMPGDMMHVMHINPFNVAAKGQMSQ